MRLDDTNDDIHPLAVEFACACQHGVGLADARGSAQEHRQASRRLTPEFTQ